MPLRSSARFRVAVLATAFPMEGIAGHAQADVWHVATSAQEQALDMILKRADHDDDQLDNLFRGRGQPNFHRTTDYTSMLTPALIRSLTRVEENLVKTDCGGHYRDGDICGLDYSPITCAQDSTATYLYLTEAASRREITIPYVWSTANVSPVATYKVINDRGRWKIDGIACEADALFNW